MGRARGGVPIIHEAEDNEKGLRGAFECAKSCRTSNISRINSFRYSADERLVHKPEVPFVIHPSTHRVSLCVQYKHY